MCKVHSDSDWVFVALIHSESLEGKASVTRTVFFTYFNCNVQKLETSCQKTIICCKVFLPRGKIRSSHVSTQQQPNTQPSWSI